MFVHCSCSYFSKFISTILELKLTHLREVLAKLSHSKGILLPILVRFCFQRTNYYQFMSRRYWLYCLRLKNGSTTFVISMPSSRLTIKVLNISWNRRLPLPVSRLGLPSLCSLIMKFVARKEKRMWLWMLS